MDLGGAGGGVIMIKTHTKFSELIKIFFNVKLENKQF